MEGERGLLKVEATPDYGLDKAHLGHCRRGKYWPMNLDHLTPRDAPLVVEGRGVAIA